MKIKEIKNVNGIANFIGELDLSKNSVYYASNGTFKTSFYEMMKSLSEGKFYELRDRITGEDGKVVIDTGSRMIFTSNSSDSKLSMMNENLKKIKEKYEFIFFDNDLMNKIMPRINDNKNVLNPLLYYESDIENFNIASSFFFSLELLAKSSNENEMREMYDLVISLDIFDDANLYNKFKSGKISLEKIVGSALVQEVSFSKYKKLAIDIKKFDDSVSEIKNELFNYSVIFNKRKNISTLLKSINHIFVSDLTSNETKTQLIKNSEIIDSAELAMETIENKVTEIIKSNEIKSFKNLEEYYEAKVTTGTKSLRNTFLTANTSQDQKEAVKKIKGIYEKICPKNETDPIWIKDAISNIIDHLKSPDNNDFDKLKQQYIEFMQQLKKKDGEDMLTIFNTMFGGSIAFKEKEIEQYFSQKTLEISIQLKGKEINDLTWISKGQRNAVMTAFLTYHINSFDDKKKKIILIDDKGDKFDYKFKQGFVGALNQVIEHKTTKANFIYFSHIFDISTSIFLSFKKRPIFYRFENIDKLKFEVVNSNFAENYSTYNKNCDLLSSIPFLRQIHKSFPFQINHQTKKNLDKILHYRESVKELTMEELLGESPIFNEIFKQSTLKKNYYNFLEESVEKIINNSTILEMEEELSNKITLAMYSRIFLEKFMNQKFKCTDKILLHFTSNNFLKEMSQKEKEIFDSVIYYMNDYMHINYIVMNPLIDTNYNKILEIANEVFELNNPNN